MTAAVRLPTPVPARPPAFRVAFQYALGGDLHYLSHRDELRMLRRALVRAAWPLRFSRGYNPMPWLSVPLPRRVGLASDCQLALTDLNEPRSAPELRDALAAVLPHECRLRALDAPAPAGTPHPQAAEYAVELPPQAAAEIAPRVARLEESLKRGGGSQGDEPDSPLTPKCTQYLERVVLDASELRLRLRFVDQRTARTSEILTEFGLAPDIGRYAVRLREVAWNMEFSDPEMGSRASKGIAIGYEENSNDSHEG